MTMPAFQFFDHDIEAWLAERKKGIGASEAAEALGISPFGSPLSLYLRKLGLLPDVEETEAMMWGNRFESEIALEYERRTGTAIVASQGFIRGPGDLSFLSATIDGWSEGGFPVEIKTTSTWGAKDIGDDESEDLPVHWLIQGHQQMILTETDRVDFAILIAGQRFRMMTIRRSDTLIKIMLPLLARFWSQVQRREAPPDRFPSDTHLYHILYQECKGEIELDDEAIYLADEIGRSAEMIKEWEKTNRRHRDLLLDRLGNAAVGRLPDGRIAKRKVIQVDEATIQRKAYTYVDLRIKTPKEDRK